MLSSNLISLKNYKLTYSYLTISTPPKIFLSISIISLTKIQL
nr:MAG TPA: hypothetical protein [Caudoviricetes sp.]